MDTLLHELVGCTDRRARFRSVVTLMLDGQTHVFEGVLEGRIATAKAGCGGFGYDPVFIPDELPSAMRDFQYECPHAGRDHRRRKKRHLAQGEGPARHGRLATGTSREMTYSTELIVLNHTKFGENSVVLHTLSRAYGRRSFLVRTGSKAGMALFLPLNLLEAVISENPRATLWHARSLTCTGPSATGPIRTDCSTGASALSLRWTPWRAISATTPSVSCWNWR